MPDVKIVRTVLRYIWQKYNLCNKNAILVGKKVEKKVNSDRITKITLVVKTLEMIKETDTLNIFCKCRVFSLDLGIQRLFGLLIA